MFSCGADLDSHAAFAQGQHHLHAQGECKHTLGSLRHLAGGVCLLLDRVSLEDCRRSSAKPRVADIRGLQITRGLARRNFLVARASAFAPTPD